MIQRTFIHCLLIAMVICSAAIAQDIQRLPPVDRWQWPPDDVVQVSAEEELPGPQEDEIIVIEQQLEDEPVENPWQGSFELGMDGTRGNSETFNFRFGFDTERKTDFDVIALDLDYNKKTADTVETANRAYLDWRYELLFNKESRFTSFVHGTVEYDEFQSFDVRVAVDSGLGYKLVDAKTTSLAARLGGGFSHEIGGPDDRYVPEAVFAMDFEHPLSKRQKFTASTEYAPDVTAMNDFRLNSQASWETLINQEMNLSVKLSALNRYDSTPHGARPNDLDYSAVLLWKF